MQRFTVTGTLLLRLALALMLVVSMASCRTTRIESADLRDSIVVVHDTVFAERLQYDSTYIDRYHSVIAIDSIVYVRDSVVLYKYKLKHDSVFIHKTDTAFVEHRVVKRVEVPRKRSWWDYFCYCVTGTILLYLLTIFKKFPFTNH